MRRSASSVVLYPAVLQTRAALRTWWSGTAYLARHTVRARMSGSAIVSQKRATASSRARTSVSLPTTCVPARDALRMLAQLWSTIWRRASLRTLGSSRRARARSGADPRPELGRSCTRAPPMSCTKEMVGALTAAAALARRTCWAAGERKAYGAVGQSLAATSSGLLPTSRAGEVRCASVQACRRAVHVCCSQW